MGFLVKYLRNFPMLMMIGCLALILKREKVLAHLERSQHVESMERSIMVIALLGKTLVLCVVGEATRLGSSLM